MQMSVAKLNESARILSIFIQLTRWTIKLHLMTTSTAPHGRSPWTWFPNLRFSDRQLSIWLGLILYGRKSVSTVSDYPFRWAKTGFCAVAVCSWLIGICKNRSRYRSQRVCGCALVYEPYRGHWHIIALLICCTRKTRRNKAAIMEHMRFGAPDFISIDCPEIFFGLLGWLFGCRCCCCGFFLRRNANWRP